MPRNLKVRPIAAAFGCVLRRARKSAKLSQRELGERADLNFSYIALLERGIQQPTICTLLKLAGAFNVSGAAMIVIMQPHLDGKCPDCAHAQPPRPLPEEKPSTDGLPEDLPPEDSVEVNPDPSV